MSEPSPERLFAAIEATWPAAGTVAAGPITLRNGQGGGKRVSAATVDTLPTDAEIEVAEDRMTRMGQAPLFILRPGEAALDTALDARGYEVVDPVVVLTAPVSALTDRPIPPVTTFSIWEPLAIMAEIWAQGGIGPERINVMHRAARKTAILARWNQKPAGVGFVAADAEIAMTHAVEVLPAQRRHGVAGWIMRQAAFWAQDEGAETMAVLCTKANTEALALYSGLGFRPATAYHYRQKSTTGDQTHG